MTFKTTLISFLRLNVCKSLDFYWQVEVDGVASDEVRRISLLRGRVDWTE